MDELVELVIPGGWGLAIGVGVGVALLAGRHVRPVAKAAVKGYLAATEGLQKASAGAKEGMQDLYAEAKAEREASSSGTSQSSARA